MDRALCPVLIDREHELSMLEDALLAANRGDGQVVVLAGDAGIGKTRLATELQRRARRLGMITLRGGCSEAELPLPYLPFLEAIGNYLEGVDMEDLRARLGPVRRELAHLFPQLEPEGVAPDFDSTQGRLRLYEAVLALLNLAAREHGLLLSIEDLHWADSSTRELLDYLTRRLRNGRIMVLATHRSDEMHRRHPLVPLIQGWRRSSTATIVELKPLTPEKVAEMVVAIFDLGDEGVQDDTREFLHARTEGNPFVLEEMLKASLDRGDIFRNDAGWTRRSLADFKLPESVRDTILLRLDRLSAEQVEVLRAAAVLGTSFSYDALLAVSGQPGPEVGAAVEACVMQQLLADDPRRTGAGYRFRHALTREATRRHHRAGAGGPPRPGGGCPAFQRRDSARSEPALGRPAEAHAFLPRRHELSDATDIVTWELCLMRHQLAVGDPSAAASSASLIFDTPAIADTVSRSGLATWSTWSFLDAGQLDRAKQAAEIGVGDGTGLLAPIRSELEAALAILEGDHHTAITHLRASLDLTDAAGYHLDACPLRRRLARLLLRRGDAEGARAELQKAFDVASGLGMVVEARLAAGELAKLGVSVSHDAVTATTSVGAPGERFVTVLFVDVRGYTAMAREKTPAELAETVATLQRWAGNTVAKHHGIVDKFAGDAVMATFNVSGAHLDHAQHALACAMAIRDKAGAMGVPLGAGIATGPAVVGSLSEGANVSVVGETTNLASRLQGKAEAGEILLAAETHRRVSDWLASNGHRVTAEKLRLKGFDEPVESWRVSSA